MATTTTIPTTTTQHAIKPQNAAPQQTLYVRNLNEKINKEKVKRELYACFAKSGTIVDIVMSKRKQARGQAWIVFEDVESASKAKVAFQGFSFFTKPLDIHFASTPSRIVTGSTDDHDGSTMPSRKRAAPPSSPSATTTTETISDGKRLKPISLVASGSNNPPSNILMVEIPNETVTKAMLQDVYDKFAGFVELRFVPSKSVAFVEYKTTTQATLALSATRGLEKGGGKVRGTFAKAS